LIRICDLTTELQRLPETAKQVVILSYKMHTQILKESHCAVWEIKFQISS